MLEDLLKVKGFAFDIETDSPSHKEEDNLNFQICKPQYIGFAYDLNGKTNVEIFAWQAVNFGVLNKIMANPKIKKIGQNIKFDAKVYQYNTNVIVQGVWYCTNLGSKMLDEEKRGHDLDSLVFKYLGEEREYPYPDWSEKLSERFGDRYILVRNLRIMEHCKEDVLKTYKLTKKLKPLIVAEGLWEWFINTEMKVNELFIQYELKGAKVDQTILKDLEQKYGPLVEKEKARLLAITEPGYNPNSPKQTLKYLYGERCELRTPCHFTKKTKAPSTNWEALNYWKNKGAKFAEYLLEYRELEKLRQFIHGLLDASSINGRVHSNFNTFGTETGRFTSTGPNLLNIPREGRGVEIRRAFPCNVIGDFEQQELKILAHWVGKGKLYEAFQRGVDVHRLTASKFFAVPIESVTKEQRDIGKVVNLGIAYGKKSGWTETWFKEYPEVKEWIDSILGKWIVEDREFINDRNELIKYKIYLGKETLGKVYSDGFVKTLAGRKRHFPELRQKYTEWYNFNAYDKQTNTAKKKLLNKLLHQEREVINSMMQGSGADILKLAICQIPSNDTITNVVVAPYDELVLEVVKSEPEVDIQQYAKLMLAANDVFKLSPKLTVEVKYAKSWGEK
jgi:DNA polymerase-1